VKLSDAFVGLVLLALAVAVMIAASGVVPSLLRILALAPSLS